MLHLHQSADKMNLITTITTNCHVTNTRTCVIYEAVTINKACKQTQSSLLNADIWVISYNKMPAIHSMTTGSVLISVYTVNTQSS